MEHRMDTFSENSQSMKGALYTQCNLHLLCVNSSTDTFIALCQNGQCLPPVLPWWIVHPANAKPLIAKRAHGEIFAILGVADIKWFEHLSSHLSLTLDNCNAN